MGGLYEKKIPKVFEVKVTIASFVVLFVVAFFACAGANSLIKLINLPNLIEVGLLALCTLYFAVLVLIALLNLLGIVKVKED